MKILVTGATGFIGRHVIDCLSDTAHEVIATGRAKHYDFGDKATYIPADLNDFKKDFFNYFQCPEVVLHLAWEGLPNYNELLHIEKNLPTSYCFLKQMIESGTRDITVLGTCFEYGLQEGCLSENTHGAAPSTSYGIAKNSLRIFLEELQKKYLFNFKWLRQFYIKHGVGQNPKSLLSQLQVALDRGDKTFNMSNGEQLRDYLPIETTANNIVRIALQNKVQGIVNNASGTPVSIRRLVEEYVRQAGQYITLNLGYYPYTTYEPMAYWGNIDKLNRCLEIKENG